MSTTRQKSTLFEWRSPACWKWFNNRARTEEELHEFLTGFTGFVAYHGCRTIDTKPYYQSGLLLADHDQLTTAARKIFVTPEFPEITQSLFDSITSRIPRGDDRKTYVVLDDQELICCSGHYLIYGSEHICGIAARLGENGQRDYRQILKRFGIPTIFKLELPFPIIPAQQIERFAAYLSESWEDLVGSKSPKRLPWSFIFDFPIPAHCVVSHSHVESIPDPLLRRLPYRYKEGTSYYEFL
jgi:hypothetical protein